MYSRIGFRFPATNGYLFQILKLEKGGDTFPLIGASGTTLGLVCDLTSLTDIDILLALSMKHEIWIPLLLPEHNTTFTYYFQNVSGSQEL